MNYNERQLDKMMSNARTFNLKVSSEYGETKWLYVSPAAMHKIRQVLIDDEITRTEDIRSS